MAAISRGLRDIPVLRVRLAIRCTLESAFWLVFKAAKHTVGTGVQVGSAFCWVLAHTRRCRALRWNRPATPVNARSEQQWREPSRLSRPPGADKNSTAVGVEPWPKYQERGLCPGASGPSR